MKKVRYTCQNAMKVRGSPYVACKLMVKDGENATPTEIARHMCSCQYFCPETQGWELSFESKMCQRR